MIWGSIEELINVLPSFIHEFVTVPFLERVTDDGTGKRYYVTPEGRHYKSVTTILEELPKPQLVAWKKRMGEEKAQRISNAATDRGTQFHAAVEDHLMNRPVKAGIQAQRLFNQCYSTLRAINKIQLIEQPLYSDTLRMAGTPDIIAEYNGVLSVIDLKTSTTHKKENWISGYYAQVGAYAKMFQERTGKYPTQGVILIAVEDSSIPQLFVKSSDECYEILKDYVRDLIDYRRSQNENQKSDSHSASNSRIGVVHTTDTTQSNTTQISIIANSGNT